MDERMNLLPDEWRPPLVVVVGMGTGLADLSAATLRWIERAEVLAGGKRLLEMFPEHPGRKIPFQSPLEDSLLQLRSLCREKRIAILASGDPFFFGIGRRLVECFEREHILAFPNVTSVQALFARLGESWQDVKAISLHGRGESSARAWLRELRSTSNMVIFTDPQHTPGWIARQLFEAGVKDRYLVVAENLGFSNETVQRLSLEEAIGGTFSPLNLVAVLAQDTRDEKGVGARQNMVFGFPEEDFQHQAGLITKMEVRAVALALLRIEANLVFWDLGAGSGSVAIEAARIAPLNRVIAVEGNPSRFRDLQENVRSFGCAEIEAICGNASEVLDHFPDPDRVFIGGSGEDLERILHLVARRLRPGGRVVQTAVTLETLERVRAFWQKESFRMSVTQVQVNRSSPVGKRLRLEALNPVFVVSVWR